MKTLDLLKRTAALTAAALMCSAGSCAAQVGDPTGGSSVTHEKYTAPPTEPVTERPRHDYADCILIGRWTDYTAELEFTAKGTVAMDMDLSEDIYFMDDRSAMISGVEVPAEHVSYDGETLSVTADSDDEEIADILTLRRTDEPDPEDIDGDYEIVSGTFVQDIIDGYSDGGDVGISIRYGDCFLRFDELFSYTQKADELTLSGAGTEQIGISTDLASDIIFELEDDLLTLYYSDGSKDVFHRVS